MKKMDKKKQRRKIRLIKSLVLVVAFLVAIGATFGITMAYFGGKSNTSLSNITLKTGIWVSSKEITGVSLGAYVVPSQVVEPECVLAIKSAKNSTDEAVRTEQASNALLRAEIVITDGTGSGTIASTTTSTYFAVYDRNSNQVGNFVKDTTNTTSNIYYFVPTSVTEYSETVRMQEIDTSNGEVEYSFKLKIQIPEVLDNDAGGAEIGISVFYQAVQADFYNSNGDMIDKTVANAKLIFGDETVSGDASYGEPTE